MRATRLHLFLLALLMLLILPPTLQAQDENRAALVVDFGDRVVTHCVAFSEEQISGYDLLVRAGLSVEIEAGGMGAAVCRLNDTGCPADDCFCQCSGGDDCVYWSYWHRTGGAWQYSAVGASAYQVGDGTVEGWTWGPGSPDQAIPPPDLSFSDVCAPAATDTPPPTATLPPPTATATLAPTINFSADAQQLVAGSCTTLRWDVQHVQAVYLDGDGVMGQGTLRVCPPATQTHTLRAVHGGGETVRQVTIEVVVATQTAAPTATSVATATSPPALPTSTSPAVGNSESASAPVGTVTPTETLPASATPATAEMVAEAAPSAATATTPLPTATVTAIVVTAPPLPTEAPAAAIAEAGAAATTQPTAATRSTAETSAAGSQNTPWFNYAGFAALVIVLGLALVVVQRREVAR